MLTVLALVMIGLWMIGLATSATMGGLIHVLLVVAAVIIVSRLIQGRPVT